MRRAAAGAHSVLDARTANDPFAVHRAAAGAHSVLDARTTNDPFAVRRAAAGAHSVLYARDSTHEARYTILISIFFAKKLKIFYF